MEFQDQPKTDMASIRKRLDWCMHVLDISKDDAYEGLAVMERVATAAHALSLSVINMAQMSAARRGYSLDELYAKVDNKNIKEPVPGVVAAPKQKPSAAFAENLEVQNEEPDIATGEWRATAGAVELAEANNLDIKKLVASGELVPSHEDGTVTKVDVRHYLKGRA